MDFFDRINNIAWDSTVTTASCWDVFYSVAFYQRFSNKSDKRKIAIGPL